MSRKVIEVVQVLVDRIHQGGYTQRALEDDIYAESQKRIAAEKDRDHWKQARQDAHEAGELMRAEIERLRKQLANAQRELSEQSMVANVETQQDAAAWQQQLDSANAEFSYLRARLDEERSVSAGLRQQLDAAQAAVTRERLDAEEQGHELGRLRAFVDIARLHITPTITYSDVALVQSALAELDAGTEPTPVAEPIDAEGGA